jgi:hypothetical protein
MGVLIASNDNWVRTIIGGIITEAKSVTSWTANAPEQRTGIGDHRRPAAGNYAAIVRGGARLESVSSKYRSALVLLLLRFTPLSSRSVVLTGDAVMIGGFMSKGADRRR